MVGALRLFAASPPSRPVNAIDGYTPFGGSVYVHCRYARPSCCAAIEAFQSKEVAETKMKFACFAVFAPAPSVSKSYQVGIGNEPTPGVLMLHRSSAYCVGSLTKRPSDASMSDRKSTRLNSSHGYIS